MKKQNCNYASPRVDLMWTEIANTILAGSNETLQDGNTDDWFTDPK